jgi:photosystem II stability/assembly factor-like uncharacterized protein
MMMTALITNKNSPEVKKVMGKVNKTKTGFTKTFNIAKTMATLKEVSIPLSKRTPFIKLAIIITNRVVTNNFISNFILVYFFLYCLQNKPKFMKKTLLTLFLITVSYAVNAQFWSEKATGFYSPSRTLNSISIVNSSVIWANAMDVSTPATPDYTIKEFTKSTDGGQTWTPGTINLGTNSANLGVSSITAVSATTAWVSAYPETGGFGGVWKTTDGGGTWTQQTSALYNTAESNPNFVYFWDANNGIAQGDPENGEFEIYTTTDGGTNWTRVPGANIPDPKTDTAGEFGYFNRYVVSGNTIWFATDRGRIFKSADKGLNWSAYTSPSTDFSFDKFTFSDANKGLLTIYNPAALYKTTDGGATWNSVYTTGYSFSTDICYIPGTSTVVIGDSATPYSSYFSTDDGLTWTNIDALSHGTMAFLDSSFGFSAGINTSNTVGGIYKFSGAALKNPVFSSETSFLAYPNPFNDVVKIQSDTNFIKKIAVFDLLGKQLYQSDFLNTNATSLDLKALNAGVYLLQVTSDTGKSEMRKIVKN